MGCGSFNGGVQPTPQPGGKMKRVTLEHVYSGLVFAALVASLLSLVASADDGFDPHQVQIRQVQAMGKGCAQGQYSVVLAPDAESMSILFDDFQAQVGAIGTPMDQSGCQIEIELEAPQGWSYTLLSAEYRGFVDLTAGVQANHTVNYQFVNQMNRGPMGPQQDFKQTAFVGPVSQDYTVDADAGVITDQQHPWFDCQVRPSIQIRTAVQVRVADMHADRSQVAGTMTLDSIDGKLEQDFGIAWTRCGSRNPGDIRLPHRPIGPGPGQGPIHGIPAIPQNPQDPGRGPNRGGPIPGPEQGGGRGPIHGIPAIPQNPQDPGRGPRPGFPGRPGPGQV